MPNSGKMINFFGRNHAHKKKTEREKEVRITWPTTGKHIKLHYVNLSLNRCSVGNAAFFRVQEIANMHCRINLVIG